MDTWAQAAEDATFEVYEVSRPTPDYRWAGGYGHGASVSLAVGSDRVPSERVVSLEIIHDVGDAEIKVNTAVVDPEMPESIQESWLRQSCLYHLTTPAYEMEAAVELPLTMVFTSADREFRIDGELCVSQGIASEINGEHSSWAGFSRLVDRDVSVVIRNSDLDSNDLSTVTNLAMPAFGRRDP